MEGIDIREMDESYCEDVIDLEEEIFGNSEYNHSWEQTKERLESPRFTCYGAFHKDELIGTLFIDNSFKSTKVRALECYIAPEYQRRGLSKKLMKQVEKYCKRNSNEGIFAIGSPEKEFLEKWLTSLGFERVGRSEYLYRGGREAIIYYKEVQRDD